MARRDIFSSAEETSSPLTDKPVESASPAEASKTESKSAQSVPTYTKEMHQAKRSGGGSGEATKPGEWPALPPKTAFDAQAIAMACDKVLDKLRKVPELGPDGQQLAQGVQELQSWMATAHSKGQP